MFCYRDHYFHDIVYPQFPQQVVGAQAPDTARGLGLTGPVHLRIIHPTVLYEEWWRTTYCMEWAGGVRGGNTWPLMGNLGKRIGTLSIIPSPSCSVTMRAEMSIVVVAGTMTFSANAYRRTMEVGCV